MDHLKRQLDLEDMFINELGRIDDAAVGNRPLPKKPPQPRIVPQISLKVYTRILRATR